MNASKKNLSERDICTKFITPAIKNAGWNIDTQRPEDVFVILRKVLDFCQYMKDKILIKS